MEQFVNIYHLHPRLWNTIIISIFRWNGKNAFNYHCDLCKDNETHGFVLKKFMGYSEILEILEWVIVTFREFGHQESTKEHLWHGGLNEIPRDIVVRIGNEWGDMIVMRASSGFQRGAWVSTPGSPGLERAKTSRANHNLCKVDFYRGRSCHKSFPSNVFSLNSNLSWQRMSLFLRFFATERCKVHP